MARKRHSVASAIFLRLFSSKTILAALVIVIILNYVTFQGRLKRTENSGRDTGQKSVPFQQSLVVAIPTDDQRYLLAKASRPARRGLRTVIATNSSSLNGLERKEGKLWSEHWIHFPDDWPVKANYRGDSRAALVPFLTHEVLGDTFEWLLYGDDDTQWFLEHVARLVQDLDSSLPYIITDNVWWSPKNGTIGSHPHEEAPRCLPCGFSAAGGITDVRMHFNAPEGCPCTPQLLCNSDERGVFDEKCSIPLHLSPVYSSRTYSLHGGAGAIMSIGLFKAVSSKKMKECIKRHGASTGGDAYVTICLWKMGFAQTDPGLFLNRAGVSGFGGVENYNARTLAKDFVTAAQDQCREDDFICKVLTEEIISFHISSRHEASHETAAESMRVLNDAYNTFLASQKAN